MLTTLKAQAKRLKAELSVLAIAYKDQRTPLGAKLLLGLTIGYMLSPIDLIPDFIPVLGLLDDLILVPLLIKLSLRLIPEAVLEDARTKLATVPEQRTKTNYLAAGVIMLLWVGAMLLAYKWVRAAGWIGRH